MIEKKIQYCPSCGSKEIEIDFEERRITCFSCGFVYYFGVVSASGCIISDGERVLVTIRGKEPGMGKYDLPGGFSKLNETFEDATRREVFEELGLRLNELEYIGSWPNRYLYRGIEYPVLDVFFLAEIPDMEIKIDHDEISDFTFISSSTFEPERFAFESHRKALNKYFSRLNAEFEKG